MTHTPTPWKPGLTRGNHGQVPVRGGDEDRVCLVDERDYGRSEGEAYDNADRIVAALNFFHGRDTPTENIPEGGFWEMVDLLKRIPAATNAANYAGEVEGAASANYQDGYAPNRQAEKAYKPSKDLEDKARALLTKLGVEPDG